MEAKNFNWDTTFDTSKKTMTHTFSDRVKVIADFKFGVIITLRDGRPVDKFSFKKKEMPIGDYKAFLTGIADHAEQLKALS
ncbi:MAG: hypothetical protein LBT50_09835 [Prevotellaceae bacterium]|jgi:hypothetical protein|nr:hypothetical protein [Prevotellaceae bacterium]